MKYGYRIAFISLCLFLAGCASTKDPAQLFKGQSAEQIYTGGEQALAKRQYSKATQHYEGLDDLYPFSPYAEQAMLDSIYAYYEKGDYATASATANRFIKVYPANPHIDYAYYMKGVADMLQVRTFSQRYLPINLASRDLTSSQRAYDDFALFVQRFPQSPYAQDAKYRMAYLRNLFAQHQVDVAEFYFKRHAYVASANRASGVLTQYPETPAATKARDILVQAYTALGETAEAEKARTGG